MTLIDERDEVLREVVYKAERPHALASAVEISRIVLNARAVAHLLYELEVIFHSLLQSLGFQVLSYALEVFALGNHVVLYLAYRLGASFLRGHEVAGRVDGYFVELFQERSCQRVYDGDLVDLVAEELYAYGVLAISYADVDNVAFHSEGASLEVGFGAAVKRIHKLV